MASPMPVPPVARERDFEALVADDDLESIGRLLLHVDDELAAADLQRIAPHRGPRQLRFWRARPVATQREAYSRLPGQ